MQTASYEKHKFLPLVSHFLRALLPHRLVHDTVHPHILEGFQMEIWSRKQEQGKRLDKECSTVKRITVDRKVAFNARASLTMEI
jgi:hypothetical protein